jgi:hypothetical protein
LDAERQRARRARRAEAQDGPSKVACGAFGGHQRCFRRQKAWFLPAASARWGASRPMDRRSRARGLGAAGGEHGFDGGGGEVMGEAFGVDAELLGGGALPVVGAEHGADVVEVAGDSVA